jgi:hypothetical protein
MPRRASGNAKRADLAATIRSQLNASSNPGDGGNRQAPEMVQRLSEYLYLRPQNLCGNTWPVSHIPTETEVVAFAPNKESPCRALFYSLNGLPQLNTHIEVDPVAFGMIDAERGDGTADV